MSQENTSKRVNISQHELHELLDLCVHLCEISRAYVQQHKPPRVAVLETKSSAEDVVTQMDKEVERLIRETLKSLRPNDGFYGEESESDRGTSGLTWVVDPIDGTVNYLHGIPHYAVSVAVVAGSTSPETWIQLAGAVIHVPNGTLWKASLGEGAWRGSQRLTVSDASSLKLSLVGTGFAYDSAVRKTQAELLVQILPVAADVRRMGSAALDLCAIAEGTLDVFYERGLNIWDFAAGTLIVREAQGVVTGLGNSAEGKNMTIAGSQLVVAELKNLLENHVKNS